MLRALFFFIGGFYEYADTVTRVCEGTYERNDFMRYMRRIDRLIQKFQPKGNRLIAIFVKPDEQTDTFKVEYHLWNENKGGFSGRSVSEYGTEQEVREFIDSITAQYPSKQAVIFIDDLGDNDEDESG